MTALFYLAIGVAIVASLLLWRKLNREAKHKAWRRDIERREYSRGIDQGSSKWPWVVNE